MYIHDAELKESLRRPLPIIVVLLSNWVLSPAVGLLSGILFLSNTQYFMTGVILLFIGSSISMVIYWNKLAGGYLSLAKATVLLNFILILIIYPLFVYFLLGVERIPVSIEIIFFGVFIFFITPFLIGLIAKKYFVTKKGLEHYNSALKFKLSKISICGFSLMLIILYTVQGNIMIHHWTNFLLITLPIIFGYIMLYCFNILLSRLLKFNFAETVSTVIIGSGNQYELAIATASVAFGLLSDVTFATSIGPLLEVPLMLIVVNLALRFKNKRIIGSRLKAVED